jgi:hypothetical protein
MNKEIKELISRYNEGYDKLQDALREIPLEVYDFKPAKNKWSIREIIAHLADSEVNVYVRCRKIIAESGSTVTTYDQDLWAANLHYASRSIDSNMELFKNICLINIALFLDIDEDAWDRFIIHPERGKIILKDYVQLEIEHVDVHIRQIKRNLAAWNEQTH